MLQNRNQDRHNIRLPKLGTIPNLKEIQGLQNQAGANSGRTVELPFGDPPENYILTVFKDRSRGDWQWMLYRGEGATSVLEWSYSTHDAGVIHNVISNQFPGSTLKNVVLPTSTSTTATDQFNTLQLHAADLGIVPGNSLTQQPLSGLKAVQRATLEGELQNLQVPNLLQSIALGKMTGRLEITTKQDTANVFFTDGVPVHCEIRGLEGDNALIEIVGWDDGAFRFYQEARSTQETIRKRLDWLLMEGAAYHDQLRFLDTHGLSMEACVMRKHISITESGFEEIVRKGPAADINMLKSFYQACDNKSNLVEVLRRRPLNKAEWVPVLYNLLSCELVYFADMPKEAASAPTEEAIEIDWAPVRTFERSMTRQDTGLYTFPAFMFFLEREFFRIERFNHPLSVVIIEIGMKPSNPQNNPDPLPLRGVREMARRIDRLKRKTDILAHYQTFDFAMLLPQTMAESARSFASRLVEVIMASPLSEEILPSSIVLSVGVVSLPEDANDLGVALAKAKPKKAL
jgi:diguanylate cyclase (GGDEF)-like protein